MNISTLLELAQEYRFGLGNSVDEQVLHNALAEFQNEIEVRTRKNLATELNISEKLEDNVRGWVESELVLWGGFGSQDRSELSKIMYPHIIKAVIKAIDKDAEYKPRVILEDTEE